MTTKVLFFDTSVLLKLFIDEDGSEIIRWLCSRETKATKRLHFVINNQVVKEFLAKIECFIKSGVVSSVEGELIKSKFGKYYHGKMFRVVGQSNISNNKVDTSLQDILKDLELTHGKNDWDGYHYESIVNALSHLAGESKPILVTADKKFGKKVKKQDYSVINPNINTEHEIEEIIAYRNLQPDSAG
jgi:hypothetical protein